MIKHLLKFLPLLVLCFLLASCHAGKKAGATKLRKRSAKYLLKKLDGDQKNLEWFSAKAKINYEDQNYRENFSANIRMRKDSIIWMNLKKVGIEGARIQITPDSFFMVNRLDKNYLKAALHDLPYMFSLPARFRDADIFQLLQDVLWGNPVFFIDKSDLESQTQGVNYVLSGADEDFTAKYHLDGLDFLLKSIIAKDKLGLQGISIDFDSYNIINDYNFPYFRLLNFENERTGAVSIALKLSKVNINTAKTIKFEIPAHYTRLD